MRVAGYCRLSRDEDKENYASITEQKNIIKEYALSRNWFLTDDDFYIDDNISGYTFNRPHFTEMMSKVQRGEIDVVIAKDLSRIGRNNGKVLVLIDEFKTMQKNLILVSEMGGTYDVLNDRDDTIGITTWYNERYVKDCSRKTRDHMYSKQKSGRLIMGNYYGYQKVFENDTPILYVIEEIRPVIELIFKLYTEGGYGFQKISDILNEQHKYPTPSAYYRKQHLKRGRVYKHKVQEEWTRDMIGNIIGNEIYTGVLITHKKRTITIRGRVAKLPPEEHFRFENHHEAIISKEVFELAKEIRKNKNETNSSHTVKKRNYYFSGLCECAECGSGVSGMMIRRKIKAKGYDCSRYRSYGRKGCVCHEIRESDILFQLKEFLKVTKQNYLDEIEKIEVNIKSNKKLLDKKKLKEKLQILNEEYKILINQKIKDLTAVNTSIQRDMIQQTYTELEKDKMIEISNLKEIIDKEEKQMLQEKDTKLKTAVEYFDEIINNNEPNKAILQTLINRIYIYKDRSLKFDLKADIKKIV